MRQIGARPPDRLVMLEEVVRATRALLHDETVDTAGRFVTLRDVRARAAAGHAAGDPGRHDRRARDRASRPAPPTGSWSPRARASPRCAGRAACSATGGSSSTAGCGSTTTPPPRRRRWSRWSSAGATAATTRGWQARAGGARGAGGRRLRAGLRRRGAPPRRGGRRRGRARARRRGPGRAGRALRGRGAPAAARLTWTGDEGRHPPRQLPRRRRLRRRRARARPRPARGRAHARCGAQAAADVRVDVGGRHDPASGDFDHHQKGGAGERENGIRYASFGLVWREYGERLAGSAEAAAAIDERLVCGVDANDVGQTLVEPLVGDIRPMSVSGVIAALNPSWDEALEPEEEDEGFARAVALARGMLERELAGRGGVRPRPRPGGGRDPARRGPARDRARLQHAVARVRRHQRARRALRRLSEVRRLGLAGRADASSARSRTGSASRPTGAGAAAPSWPPRPASTTRSSATPPASTRRRARARGSSRSWPPRSRPPSSRADPVRLRRRAGSLRPARAAGARGRGGRPRRRGHGPRRDARGDPRARLRGVRVPGRRARPGEADAAGGLRPGARGARAARVVRGRAGPPARRRRCGSSRLVARRRDRPRRGRLRRAGGGRARSASRARACWSSRRACSRPTWRPDPGSELVFSPFPPSLRAEPGAVAFRAGDPPQADGDAVYLTLGTVFNAESGDLLPRALAGVRSLGVPVVVTTGRQIDPDELGRQPPHVRVQRWIPHEELLPWCRAIVSHAGSGSALARSDLRAAVGPAADRGRPAADRRARRRPRRGDRARPADRDARRDRRGGAAGARRARVRRGRAAGARGDPGVAVRRRRGRRVRAKVNGGWVGRGGRRRTRTRHPCTRARVTSRDIDADVTSAGSTVDQRDVEARHLPHPEPLTSARATPPASGRTRPASAPDRRSAPRPPRPAAASARSGRAPRASAATAGRHARPSPS